MGQRKILSPHEDFLSSQPLFVLILVNFGRRHEKCMINFFHEIAIV